MIKRFLCFFLTIVTIITFSGCDSSEPEKENCHYGETYICGFMEECSNGTKYIKVNSFEVSTVYEYDDILTEGYYVILGVETNFEESDFIDENSFVCLRDGTSNIKLNYIMWDVDNEKLVYEIPQHLDINYSHILNLKISNAVPDEHSITLSLDYDVYAYDLFRIDGVQYAGRVIELYLEEQTESD